MSKGKMAGIGLLAAVVVGLMGVVIYGQIRKAQAQGIADQATAELPRVKSAQDFLKSHPGFDLTARNGQKICISAFAYKDFYLLDLGAGIPVQKKSVDEAMAAITAKVKDNCQSISLTYRFGKWRSQIGFQVDSGFKPTTNPATNVF